MNEEERAAIVSTVGRDTFKSMRMWSRCRKCAWRPWKSAFPCFRRTRPEELLKAVPLPLSDTNWRFRDHVTMRFASKNTGKRERPEMGTL